MQIKLFSQIYSTSLILYIDRKIDFNQGTHMNYRSIITEGDAALYQQPRLQTLIQNLEMQ